MSPVGTKLPIRDVRCLVAIGGKRTWDGKPILVAIDRAARLAAIPAGESPANRGVQSLV
jgi:hypothetical protein